VHWVLRTGVAGCLLLVCACSNGSADAASQRQGGARPDGGVQGGRGPDSADRGGRGGRRGASVNGEASARAGGRAGGARLASIVLGAADVYLVSRGVIEATIPIAGDLRPLETVVVRSRVDGILESVYVREGQTVANGALLARFESAEQEAQLRSAEAEVAAARSDFETARWNAEQSRELFRVGAISERELRSAEQAAEAARARQAAAEARHRTASNALRDTRVVAPFAGTIDKRFVQAGENTSRGAQMFTLVRSLTLELTASLPARRADEVKVGQSVRFVANDRHFTGRIARLSPVIDPASRSVTVYVQIPNPRGELKGNTFATGQVVSTAIEDALIIPQSSVRASADGASQFVYRIQGGELAVAPVQLGIADETRGVVQVRDGLHERDQIVVGSPGTLGPGMKVQIIGGEGGGRRGRGRPSAP
jgi:RND family efflux transporter MFP subunit